MAALDLTGTTVAGYRVAEKIGPGPSGTLYRAEQVGAPAAKKRVIEQIGPVALRAAGSGAGIAASRLNGLSAQFETVSRLVATGGSAHVVDYFQTIAPDRASDGLSYAYVLMEDVVPFSNYIAARGLTVGDAVKVAVDVLDGLAFCHEHGIVHGNLRFSSIFAARDGSFKVGGFGACRVLDDGSGAVLAACAPTYLSPAVYLGEREYGADDDVYAVAILLYRMLNGGRGPLMPDYPAQVTASSEATAVRARMEGARMPSPKLGGHAISSVLLKALAADKPGYGSAREFASALEKAKGASRDALGALACAPGESDMMEGAVASKRGRAKKPAGGQPSTKERTSAGAAGAETMSKETQQAILDSLAGAAGTASAGKGGTADATTSGGGAKPKRHIGAIAAVVLLALGGIGAWAALNPTDAQNISASFGPGASSSVTAASDEEPTGGEADQATDQSNPIGSVLAGWGIVQDGDGQGTSDAQDSAGAAAQDTAQSSAQFESDGFTWSLFGGGYSLTGYSGTGEYVEIPGSYNGKPVVRISDGAFSGSNIVAVIIPDSVSAIGDRAFKNCARLESVEMSHLVSAIGQSAFEGCESLPGMTLPSSLTKVESSAFEGCTSMAWVEVPYGVTSIGTRAFFGDSSLGDVVLPATLQRVGAYAFNGCPVTQDVLPQSVTYIGERAFS